MIEMETKGHVIVLGRQFGSGGRVIGKALAERLGIPYYDKELMSEAARRIGFSEEIFQKADERPKFFHFFTGSGYGSAYAQGSQSSMSREGLYRAQSRVIREIASEGPCVIVGRTADYVLRDFPNMVSVFLHAPIDWRAARIVKRHDCDTLDEAMHLARRHDSGREKYYNYFTGRHWGHCDNYHLSLDPSVLGLEGTLNVITTYLEKRQHTDGKIKP